MLTAVCVFSVEGDDPLPCVNTEFLTQTLLSREERGLVHYKGYDKITRHNLPSSPGPLVRGEGPGNHYMHMRQPYHENLVSEIPRTQAFTTKERA